MAWTADGWSNSNAGVVFPETGVDDHDKDPDIKDLWPTEIVLADNEPICALPAIHFVETERLRMHDSVPTPMDSSFYYGIGGRLKKELQPALTVAHHSDKLADLIQKELAAFGTLSQALESSFPARLIKKMGKNGVSDSDVKKRLEDIEQKRERLARIGILPADRQSFSMPANAIDENTREVLAIYAEDTEAKLGMLEETASKIELFTDIINRRFRYKSMEIAKTGYLFRDHRGEEIPITVLSSGEQHQLVMLYQLLFEIKPGTLVLIDEPELSLHIAWAKQFIKDLLAITALAGIDVLIATHSPDLIHDRWDLTVELKGPALP